MRIVWGFVVTLVLACAGAKLVGSDARAANAPVTVSFTEVGSKTFIVPAGVTSLHVVAVGAPGGDGEYPGTEELGLGGLGGIAIADVVVAPGQTLTVYVGGPGETKGEAAGGFNGGGKGSKYNGGGGGASDLRGTAGDLTSRLVVAGGGGGGGSENESNTAPAAGGAAGNPGGSNKCGGGGSGTSTAGGAGGKGSSSGKTGGAGVLGQGGNGPNGGAGGGGGLYGGGAGGEWSDQFEALRCGGGGGSSGFGPGTSGTSVAISQSRTPSVTITYVPASSAETPAGSGGSTNPGGSSPSNPDGSGPGAGSGATKASLSLPAVQQGKAVVGTVKIPADRSSLGAKLYLRSGSNAGPARARAGKTVVAGKLTEAPLKKGLHSFTVRLNGKGKKALRKLGSLKLTLSVKVTPPAGAVATATKPVKLKR